MESTLIITGGILLGCLIGLSWFAGTDAPYIPTKIEVVKKILKLAGVKKGKKFYELGSGDGRVVTEAARLGAYSVGIEQSWLRVLYSRWKARKQNLPNAKFIHGDIFHHLSLPRKRESINNADIIYIFLLNKGVAKLEEKLKSQLKKGSKVITQTYHFPNWKPDKKMGEFWVYKV